jgi:hypothetical protein
MAEADQVQFTLPDNSFLSAIDNHNVANGDESWFDKKLSDTGGFLTDVAEGATKGTFSAVVAGVNSILNSAVAVANFVGADIEEINTYEVLKGFDDDLGQYYKEHKAGVELAGFVAGSFLPGMAGVKAMQAAKAGFLGTNMAKSSNLMQSLTRDYATAAKIEFSTGASPFSVLNQNVAKALAQGFGAAALEMTAFETAVAASMFKSPVLGEQNAGNIAWNIATGTLIGGGIGGVLHGVGAVYGIKRSGAKVDRELFPFKNIQELEETAPTDLKLINYFQQKLNLPEAKLAEDYGPIRPGEVSELDPAARLSLITTERQKTTERLDVLIRQEFNRYAGGDEVIGQQLFEKFKDQKSLQDIIAALINSKGAQRITANERLLVGDVLFPTHGLKREEFRELLTKGDYSKFLNDTATAGTTGYRIIGDISKLKVGGAGEKAGELGYLENRDAAFAAGIDLYRNLNGTFSVNPTSTILRESATRRTPNNLIIDFEQGGAIVDKATPGLADIATKSRPIEVRGNTVLAGDLNPIKIGNTFNPLEDDYLAVQARYIWAAEQKNLKWQDRVVHERDLPMLEKAYFDGDAAEGWRIRKEDGTFTGGLSGDNLRRFIEAKKVEFAQKLDGKPVDELELRLNVSRKWLEGSQDELAKLRPGVDYKTPRYARIDYPDSVHAMETYNAAHLDGAVSYENAISAIVARHKQTFNNYAGNLSELFPDAPNWADPTRTPTREGAGASLWGFANSNYGSAGGWAQFVGSIVNRLKVAKKTATVEALNNVAASIFTPELRSELDLITNKLRSSPEAWVFHPTDSNILIQRKEFKLVSKGEEASETINLTDPISDFLRTHSSINSERQVHVKNMKAAAGVMDDADLQVVYPPPIDTAKYKHFVFVEPKGFTLGDRKRVIVAKDEATLLKLVDNVDKNDFRIITKTESEEWHKAIGDYDFQLGLNESLVDSTLKRKGILSDHFAGNPSQEFLMTT